MERKEDLVLLGFRRRRSENGQLIFTRREFDIWQRPNEKANRSISGEPVVAQEMREK